MSNDYAAILTTLDGAILVIGTAQFVSIHKRLNERQLSMSRERFERKGRLIEALQRGEEPDDAELFAVRERPLLSPDTLLLSLAFLVWGTLVASVVAVQIKVLRWAAMAGARPEMNPDPGLARLAYLITGAAILVLLFEAMTRVLIRAWRFLTSRESQDYRERYSSETRRELDEKVKEAVGRIPRKPWSQRARGQFDRLR
ncbi:hypothetical protein [Streptomyces coeruleorubidus]|uniref:hypothetical protein n=1 Tax=Streptomyces coeruleorubidus TaxID=116188 RepID=UPI003689D607